MEDIWHTFPAQMGDDQAWITYNHGFAEVAEADKRGNCLRVRVTIKNPTEYGMPTNEEFPALSSLDESIDDAITAAGGVYVGRITVAGCRFFYYYAEGAGGQDHRPCRHGRDARRLRGAIPLGA